MIKGSGRVGFLGLDHGHAHMYAESLARRPGIDMLVWDADADMAVSFAERHGGQRFASTEAVLAAGVDAVIVCGTNASHRFLVEQAAGSVPLILCEKPLATTVPDAEHIVRTCARRKTKLLVAFPMRFSRPFLDGIDLLRSGRLGRPLSIVAVNQGKLPGGWFLDPVEAGGGAIMDHTVHLADALRWLVDSPITEVYAVATSGLAPEAAVETGALLSVRFDNGAIASIDASWSRPSSYPTWGGLSMAVQTTLGTTTIDGFGQALEIYPAGLEVPRWSVYGDDPYDALIAHFLDVMAGTATPVVTGLDGVLAQRVVEAAYASVESMQPVSVSAAWSDAFEINPSRPHR